ncbi:MAG: hypothetical protein ACE5JU_15250, partial [Candidatus Binatia bacterium]
MSYSFSQAGTGGHLTQHPQASQRDVCIKGFPLAHLGGTCLLREVHAAEGLQLPATGLPNHFHQHLAAFFGGTG